MPQSNIRITKDITLKYLAIILLLIIIAPINAALNTAQALTIEAEVNSQSSVKPGPIIQPGLNANWTYTVNNNDNLELNNVQLLKRQKSPSLGQWETICQLGSIKSGASASCSHSEIAIEGGYKAIVVARGNTGSGEISESTISAFYQGSSFVRLSVTSNGNEGNNHSDAASISADGQTITFRSTADNLVPGDTNDRTDVFVYDLKVGEVSRVSVASDGAQANSDSPYVESPFPDISADGRYVVFSSYANNLVPDDNNGTRDIFLHDRMTKETTRVSIAIDGTDPNNESFLPSISADGRYIEFGSYASNLVPGDFNSKSDVFVHDRNTGKTSRVSVSSIGSEGNNFISSGSISSNGRYVSFSSSASNLVQGDTNGEIDSFVHDTDTGRTSRISISSDGIQGNGRSFVPVVSDDGRYAIFQSRASNLVPGDTNNSEDIFIHDRISGDTRLVSVASDGAPGNDRSFGPSISSDNQHIFFASYATNLVPDDINDSLDIFSHNRVTGVTSRITTTYGEIAGLSFTANGQSAVFGSNNPRLVSGDTNGIGDVFLYQRQQQPPLTGTAEINIKSQLNGQPTTKPGPTLSVGNNLTWNYTASNKGNSILHDVEVRVRQKLPTLGSWETACTLGSINPGISVSCNVPDLATNGIYKALVVVRGTTHTGEIIENSSDVFYTGETGSVPALSLSVNANNISTIKPGPSITEGSNISWTYNVANDGQSILNNVEIRGRQKTPTLGNWETLCAIASIQPGTTGSCSSTSAAISGIYKSLIIARTNHANSTIEDSANAFYTGQAGTNLQHALSLTTTVNGQTTDKPGPSISSGSTTNWTYTVSNDGNVDLHNILVTGRQKVPTLGDWETFCSFQTIAPGTTQSCTSTGKAISGTFKSLIVARSTLSTGENIEDKVDAFYIGKAGTTPQPSISLQTFINGQASDKPGPSVTSGDNLSWNYAVTNDGNAPLTNISIRGRQKLPTLGNWETLCTINSIQPGSTISCSTSSNAISGIYKALILAQGSTDTGILSEATENAFYNGSGTTTSPFGLTSRPSLAPLSLPGDGLPLGNYELEDKFPNLRFADSLYLTAHPEDDRIVVLEQHGLLHVFPNDSSVTQTKIALDLSNRVIFANEQGLLGLAFDPAFSQNHYIYIHYSMEIPRRSVIARFTWEPGTDQVDISSEKILLEIPQPAGNHNGGMLAFGPDGYLYISLGDGSSGGDVADNAQNKNTLLGSILRIDVHPNNPGAPYDIPSDNPFVGQANAREEIYAYGLRNPFRFSFDRQTGNLWLGDVGESTTEEINLIESGGNYGWRVLEGTTIFNDSTNTLPLTSFIPPLYQYDHSVGFAIIGGYVYRGNKIPSLLGRYIYTDFVTGTVWALDYDGSSVTSNEPLTTARRPTSFGEDNDGELYIVTRTQGIYGLVETAGNGGNIPDLLSETGIFTNMSNLEIANGLIEYDINHPFHSDNAIKRRWVGVPDNKKVSFDAKQAWSFPQGSVIVKHFEMEMTEGDPASRKRLETRLLLHTTQGWQGFTYRWNGQGTEATLLSGRKTEQLTITNQTGGTRTQLYEYPSRTDCIACHTEAAGFTLGLTAPQLNRNFDYNGIVDNQLRSLNNIDLFTSDIGDASSYSKLPAIDDTASSIEHRARTYLNVNCAQCHQPQGTTPVDIDLRLGIANSAMKTIGLTPQTGDLGITGAQLIKPGSKSESVLWQRINRLDNERMPPLSSHVIDQQAVDIIGQWIDAM